MAVGRFTDRRHVVQHRLQVQGIAHDAAHTRHHALHRLGARLAVHFRLRLQLVDRGLLALSLLAADGLETLVLVITGFHRHLRLLQTDFRLAQFLVELPLLLIKILLHLVDALVVAAAQTVHVLLRFLFNCFLTGRRLFLKGGFPLDCRLRDPGNFRRRIPRRPLARFPERLHILHQTADRAGLLLGGFFQLLNYFFRPVRLLLKCAVRLLPQPLGFLRLFLIFRPGLCQLVL